MSADIPAGNAAEPGTEGLEDSFDAALVTLARAEQASQETVPLATVRRLSDGEVPVGVWREYRGLSSEQLAAIAHVQEELLAAVEAGKEDVPLRIMHAIARGLRLDLDDLVPWSAHAGTAVPAAPSADPLP
jgi:DNA-binding XRE family transcriptional regulator